ncbi:MAG: hypothetical protein IPM32_06290 [Ignavibacteriae bacterium]|nr:hypothetical protein [Ignavibacteriota bacterium]
MNTGQMLISIAAMILLSIVIINVNRNSLTNTQNMDQTKYEILAVSLGNAVIHEAFSKAFDEETANNNIVNDEDELTLSLGHESGELNRKDFDDFDDYNYYSENTKSDSTIISADFNINCRVFYVDPNVSLDYVNNRTYHKRIEVSVTSPFLNEGQDTVKLSKINSHFYFR